MFQFVRKKLPVSMALLVTGIALIGALGQHTRARQASVELTAQRTEQARVLAQIAKARHDLAAARQAANAPTLPLAPQSPADDAQPSPRPLPVTGVGGELAELIAENPELSDAYQANERAEFIGDYMPFMHAMAMSSQKREHFLRELSEREKNAARIRITARQSGWESNDHPSWVRLNEEEAARRAEAFGRVLGAEGYRQFQEFERTKGVRSVVTELATELYTTTAPLDGAVAERLVQALAVHAVHPDGRIYPNSIRWDSALPAVQDILLADQFALLVKMRKAQEQQQRLNRLGAGRRPPPAN